MQFDRNVRIAGLILNNVAGDRHAGYVTEALAGRVRAPVVGVVRRKSEIKMEERHLGLVPAPELQKAKRRSIIAVAKYVADQIDIDRISGLCGKGELPDALEKDRLKKRARIAVALDESFNFYYADNLDSLKRTGAQLEFFSPVHDCILPSDIDGIMLGGGFPEVLADRLEKNQSMIKSIRKAVEGGMPVYGECGGLMYLTRSIRGYRGEKRARKMAGLVDADTLMTRRLTLNYTEAECKGPVFGKAHLRGHEFHYSLIENVSRDSRFAYSMKKGKGITCEKDGLIVNGDGVAAYMHLHFSDKLAGRLVQACANHSRR
jgi:cobyrinic acid a,c-diamide synthase